MLKKKIYRIYILAFIFTLHIAISAYVNSTFIEQSVGEKYVGLMYTIASIITLLLLSNTSVILKHFGNKKLTLIFLLCNMFALSTFVLTDKPAFIIPAFIVFLSTNILVLFCIDIFIEHFGTPETIGKTRGVYLTITNLAWVASPIISSYLINKSGDYKAIYLMAFMMTIQITFWLFVSINNFDDKAYIKTPFMQIYRFLRTNKHIMAITIINFILQFFFAIMVIYTPIYLHDHLSITWNNLGIIFTIMLVPFVLLSVPLGKLIDNYHIPKRLLITIGIFIMSASTIFISGIHDTSVVKWAIVLFATRVGAAIVETVSEIYFFTHVREEDAYLLSFFRDMHPLSYIIAPLLGTLFLSIFDFKYLFLALGIFVLSGLYYITRLKHNHEPRIPITNQ
jgi:MFS family permease